MNQKRRARTTRNAEIDVSANPESQVGRCATAQSLRVRCCRALAQLDVVWRGYDVYLGFAFTREMEFPGRYHSLPFNPWRRMMKVLPQSYATAAVRLWLKNRYKIRLQRGSAGQTVAQPPTRLTAEEIDALQRDKTESAGLCRPSSALSAQLRGSRPELARRRRNAACSVAAPSPAPLLQLTGHHLPTTPELYASLAPHPCGCLYRAPLLCYGPGFIVAVAG